MMPKAMSASGQWLLILAKILCTVLEDSFSRQSGFDQQGTLRSIDAGWERIGQTTMQYTIKINL
jgi:hypothetical protein